MQSNTRLTELDICFLQLKSLSVLRPVLQKPSVRRTTPVCVGHFMKETASPVQVDTLKIQNT